jgi:hypothetical protein
VSESGVPDSSEGARAGLCGRCRHGVWLHTPRSAFLRCALSDTDPRFPRYPRLPVLACAGFRDAAAAVATRPDA